MASSLGGSKTIVVADETAFVRDRFRTALEQAGHTVVAVRTTTELLARIRADHEVLDLLLLDVKLTHPRGVDLVRSIRSIDHGRVPILIFSGTIATANEVRELGALGVMGYVNEYTAVSHILPSLAPHLFPDQVNRRRSPRVVLATPVQYRLGPLITAALTLNLSRGGLAIRTINPLAIGTIVTVRFRLPDSPRDVSADGHVVWAHRGVGMGLQFDTVDPSSQIDIDRYVEAHSFQTAKPKSERRRTVPTRRLQW
jgi:uncharacterized protein (TIGR02266 family)